MTRTQEGYHKGLTWGSIARGGQSETKPKSRDDAPICYHGRFVTMKIRFDFLMLALVFTGCFYPPTQQPIPVRRDRVEIPLPYDLAWNAVHDVIARNHFHIIAEDPNHGLIETQAPGGFTLKDADCGEASGIVGKIVQEPDIHSSAVYNFRVAPAGNESSTVIVQATFVAPLHVPLHATTAVKCVSRGYAEGRLLEQIAEHAREVHRPSFKSPQG